jgi:lysyl-tRNA synthetase class 2
VRVLLFVRRMQRAIVYAPVEGKPATRERVTMTVDETLLHRLTLRATALRAARAFFDTRGFLECETPMLVPGPGLEPHIDPLAVDVVTHIGGERSRRWLHTSPELALKRVVAAGAPLVYQLARVFRDGERTSRHLPEFTMLEWYRAHATLDVLISDCMALATALADALHSHVSEETRAVLGRPIVRASVHDLFMTHAGIDLREALVDMQAGNAHALPERARTQGMHLRPNADFEDAFFDVMAKCVEPAIGNGEFCVVERWPARMAVLARRCDDDALFAERFEIYVNGLELCNAFDELTDPVEQRARFIDDNRVRCGLGKAELPLDEDFLSALSSMPRTSGIALGFDRLLMWLTGQTHIDDVMVLPWR